MQSAGLHRRLRCEPSTQIASFTSCCLVGVDNVYAQLRQVLKKRLHGHTAQSGSPSQRGRAVLEQCRSQCWFNRLFRFGQRLVQVHDQSIRLIILQHQHGRLFCLAQSKRRVFLQVSDICSVQIPNLCVYPWWIQRTLHHVVYSASCITCVRRLVAERGLQLIVTIPRQSRGMVTPAWLMLQREN